ncbi:hypothetical protein ACIQWA_07335 [Kitasatospora sp. NPDC098652]|uniref:hypothetical protein n=1 Tax=Kitasatospora sp. NPDC098652 TaxID=3364095 RepID=UPI003829EB5B
MTNSDVTLAAGHLQDLTEQLRTTYSEKQALRILRELNSVDDTSVFGALKNLLGAIAVTPCRCSPAYMLGQKALDQLWELSRTLEETTLAFEDPDGL